MKNLLITLLLLITLSGKANYQEYKKVQRNRKILAACVIVPAAIIGFSTGLVLPQLVAICVIGGNEVRINKKTKNLSR